MVDETLGEMILTRGEAMLVRKGKLGRHNSVAMSVRFRRDVLEKLNNVAKEQDVFTAEIVRELVEDYLTKQTARKLLNVRAEARKIGAQS